MEAGQQLILESDDHFLCVYFISFYNIKYAIYVDGKLFKSIKENSSLYGIDFGDSSGKIVFTAIEQTKLRFSAVVFPNVCKNYRIISNVPFTTFYFSNRENQKVLTQTEKTTNEFEKSFLKRNFSFNISSRIQKIVAPFILFLFSFYSFFMKPSKITNNLKFFSQSDYQIEMNQQLCIWSAVPFQHYLKVNLDTEFQFDILKLWTSHGVVHAFSGVINTTLHSQNGCEFFSWETDSTIHSNFFDITIETIENGQYPIFSQILSGYQASDVNLFFSIENSDDNYKDHKKKKSYIEKSIPYILVITVILLICAITSIIWAIKVNKSEKEFQFSQIIGEEMAYVIEKNEISENYQHAQSDLLPLPYMINSSERM
ncbi:hypothetical protein TRFO_41305 [Tritrichomonas foetus]|uniref:Transmembrane protein n=1 Tax=Tritrichomonas foetus TaxID=1144522 RepID=A0A1J4L0X8_9EUKA|nr:hypothetical protein TRFO_41305 [Tritrichomonas foetus]|eukprot:OHT17083.1 hypothetical protein TRFO_41305 [Tritrichomonas foetus]